MLVHLAQPYYMGSYFVLQQLDMLCFVDAGGRPAFTWMETEGERLRDEGRASAGM